MIRNKFYEIKFKTTKYVVYEVRTIEKLYYDLEKYSKFGCFWLNSKTLIKNKEFEYIRFETYEKLNEYILNLKK